MQQLGFVLSEDSGLMHMSWVWGIPTLALFGGVKNVRPYPLGEHSGVLWEENINEITTKVVCEMTYKLMNKI